MFALQSLRLLNMGKVARMRHPILSLYCDMAAENQIVAAIRQSLLSNGWKNTFP